MLFENRNYAFAGAFVDELARCGLHHVCISPGSRSSPLTIAFARHPAIKSWVHLDERSSAFFALGIARVLGEPVALVCTSGTAAGNFYPAVVEACYSSVPLLVLTADRPPELWEWGAPQTIDQVRMYGSHAKWTVTMPPPEATTPLMAFVRSMACRAFATALATPSGPVHVDFPFREPLEPAMVPADFPKGAGATGDEAWRGRPNGVPFIRMAMPERQLSVETVKPIATALASTERGIIVCGPQPDPALAEVLATLAHRLGYPILADPLSQVRCGPHDLTQVIDSYDAILRDPRVASALAPQVVLRFGAIPTSKSLSQYLEGHPGARHILVDSEQAWRDPFHVTSEVVPVDLVCFCTAMTSALGEGRPAAATWASRWRTIATAARTAIQRELDRLEEEMFEGKVFSELARLLPDHSTIFAGNSMPVRDMDTFSPSTAKRIRFTANRGASGIDGVISTALGESAVHRGRLVLVIGDISFYHDMNGLLAAKAYSLDATIIVINNDGGGIFSFLPQASYEEVFEPYFGTPHGVTFQAAAEMYGLDYCKVVEWRNFREAVAHSIAGAGTTIIEVPGDRAVNVALHQRIWQSVATAIGAGVGG